MGLTPTKLIILGNKLVECFKLTEEVWDNEHNLANIACKVRDCNGNKAFVCYNNDGLSTSYKTLPLNSWVGRFYENQDNTFILDSIIVRGLELDNCNVKDELIELLSNALRLTEEYDNCYHKDTCDNTCTQSDNCSYYKLTKALKLLGVD